LTNGAGLVPEWLELANQMNRNAIRNGAYALVTKEAVQLVVQCLISIEGERMVI
jgi:hypothetical protein